jgi:FemAB-related protein (PEP-CTERM system-associated)
MDTTLVEDLEIHTYGRGELAGCLPRLEDYLTRRGRVPLSYHPGWLNVLAEGLGQSPYCLEATEGERTRGFLALSFIRSLLFGRYLVSLPYLNYGGPIADDSQVARRLIDRAVELAGRLDVRYLELRQEQTADHPALGHTTSEKVHMRMPLPATAAALWDALSPKVRNQVRKGQKCRLTVGWGGLELLPEFHAVFSRNMRDLGTPSYGQTLFRNVLRQFPDRSEFCVVRAGGLALAGALLLHGWGVTEVPSASSLRSHNHTNSNMLMYWHLLERAIERGQDVFDFGRSSRDSNTYRFKRQWGATPAEAVWQYHLRYGGLKNARPDNPRYQRLIRLWRRLPVGLTRLVGPMIVRGIP